MINSYNIDNNKTRYNNVIPDSGVLKIYYSEIIEDTNPLVRGGRINPENMDNTIFTGGENTYNLSLKKYDIYGVSKYISNLLIQFIKEMQLLNQCNQYASPSEKEIPADCQNTFKEYNTHDKISQNKNNNTMPLYQTSMMTGNRRKHLQQQLNDLNNLIFRFNNILTDIASSSNLPRDQYNDIIRLNAENVELRNDLDQKLGEIYEYNDSRIVNSKLHLDSTVYAGVLWSILASSLIYIIFTKM
jgi:hypothetical protein